MKHWILAVVLAGSIAGAAAAADAQAPLRPVRISTDPLAPQVPGSHATEVEPSAAAFGSRVVSVFQVGRRFGGGASAIGFATSANGGRSWRSGILPQLTQASSPPGQSANASDPVVAYDAAHGRWLATTLAGSGGRNVIFVSRSTDGLTWDAPVVARATTPLTLDKEWIACDNGRASPFRGHCYLAYSNFEREGFGGAVRLAVQTSDDGGLTWGAPVLLSVAYNAATDTLSAQPVVTPGGTLVIVFFERTAVRAVRSLNGGVSFGARQTISSLTQRAYSFHPDRFRGTPTPTVAADRAGVVYAAWYDCRFRPACAANDVVLSRSRPTGGWTRPQRIPLGRIASAADFVLPALAVDPRSAGRAARIGLAYYSLTSPDCAGPDCRVRAGLALSITGGRRWTIRAIASSPMPLEWMAPTTIGHMLGDYVAPVVSGNRLVDVLVLARRPEGARLDEAVYAVSLPFPRPKVARSRRAASAR